jgi:adenylate cyclase
VAYTLGYFGEEIDVVIALLDRGLQLNPSSARAWQWSGWLRLWAGEPDLAIEHFETSLRLNPREQRANPFMGIGVAHFFAERLNEARVTLLRSLQRKAELGPYLPISCVLLRAYGSS